MKCQACGIQRQTHFHHYKYAYMTKEIRKDPDKALENTVQLCFPCHMMADNIRKIEENYLIFERVYKVIKAARKNMGGYYGNNKYQQVKAGRG